MVFFCALMHACSQHQQQPPCIQQQPPCIHPQQAALHSTCQMYSQAETPTQTTPPPPPPQPPSPPSGLAAVPPVAKILGFAGAIPFLALTPQLVHSIPLLPDAWVANAGLLQIGYGVSIASFLGGIHWALAMAEYGGTCVFGCCDLLHTLCETRPIACDHPMTTQSSTSSTQVLH